MASRFMRCCSTSTVAMVLSFNVANLFRAASVPGSNSVTDDSFQNSRREVKSFVWSHGSLIQTIFLTPCSNSNTIMMFSVIFELSSLVAVSRGKAMLMTVVMIECANTASQLKGVIWSKARRNGANAILWYSSAVSMYDKAAGDSVDVAACKAATARIPLKRKSCSNAFRGTTICQTWKSDGSLLRLIKVSVENLCISSKLRRPEAANGPPGSLIAGRCTIGARLTLGVWLPAGLDDDCSVRSRALGIFKYVHSNWRDVQFEQGGPCSSH